MLVQLIVGLIVIGFLLWLVNAFIPMDGRFKQLVNVLAIVGAIIWVVRALGLFTGF